MDKKISVGFITLILLLVSITLYGSSLSEKRWNTIEHSDNKGGLKETLEENEKITHSAMLSVHNSTTWEKLCLVEEKITLIREFVEYLYQEEAILKLLVIPETVRETILRAENATGRYEIAGVLWDDEYRFVVRLIEWRSIGDGEYSIEHTVDIIKQDGSWTVQQDIISSIDPWKEDYVNQLTTLSEDLRNLKRLVNPLREADIRAAMDAAKEAQMDPVFTGLMTEEEKELFRQNLTAVYDEEWEDKHVDIYAMRKDHRNYILLIWVQYTGEEGLIREEVIRGIYGTDGINGYPFVVVQDGDTWSARHEGSIPDPEPPEG